MGRELYLLMGSNLGNRLANLNKALEKLSTAFGIASKISSVYESAPWGNDQQAAFLNQVVVFRSSTAPRILLDEILRIENEMGRIREYKWGPRLIDIDILYYGDLTYNDEALHIPHPYIAQRRFTLMPLVELSPEMIHPLSGKNNAQLLADCEDPLSVNLFKGYS